MISPDLHALGFDYPEWDDLVRAMISSPMKSIMGIGPFGAVGLYQDESGAAISLFQYQDEPPYTTPSLQGTRGHHVKAYQLYPSLALLDKYEDDDKEPTHRLLAYVDDPHCYPILDFENESNLAEYKDYRLSAVALDVHVYRTIDEWEKDQKKITAPDPSNPNLRREVMIGPTFITSPWLFALYSGDNQPQEANASAMFKAVVSHAELKINQLTGQRWWRCEADCGFPIIVALPHDVNLAPIPGSVIDGSVLLLGSSGYWD